MIATLTYVTLSPKLAEVLTYLAFAITYHICMLLLVKLCYD